MSSSSRLGIASKTCMTAGKSAAVCIPVAATPPVLEEDMAGRSELAEKSGNLERNSCGRQLFPLVHVTPCTRALHNLNHENLGDCVFRDWNHQTPEST